MKVSFLCVSWYVSLVYTYTLFTPQANHSSHFWGEDLASKWLCTSTKSSPYLVRNANIIFLFGKLNLKGGLFKAFEGKHI